MRETGGSFGLGKGIGGVRAWRVWVLEQQESVEERFVAPALYKSIKR
jgi:hypothetical protein